ncbi:MAG: endo-1,4-beta-xylanase [Armatimonadetes bacterium]|nr:endo-1,4-beta-xylanase [Armatimonadota bacterium]
MQHLSGVLPRALVLAALPVTLFATAARGQELDACPFGFSCDHHTTFTLAEYCGSMAAVGLRWIRGFPGFDVIEPEQGRFEWAAPDKFVATADAHGMRVSGLLGYSVPWIEPGSGSLPVKNLAAWSEYVAAVVQRYKGRVSHWEVWNETPNFMPGQTAGDYARTVVAAYEAAKRVDPACHIGLSIQSVNIHWIEEVIDAGARDHFDFIALHPYEVLGLVESDGLEAQFMSIVPTLRKMLKAKNPSHADVPVWFTEIGYNAEQDEPGQASALVKAFVMGIAQGVERIFWFEGIDGDSGPMGLLRADGTRRLAYTAAATLTAHLGPSPQYIGWVLLNGRHYGFVFRGPSGLVMAAWARPNARDYVEMGGTVRVVDPFTGASDTEGAIWLTSQPLLILDVPDELARQASANRSRPFPWDGDYSAARSVFVLEGEPNTERGLHHLGADRTSTPAVVDQMTARDCSKGAAQAFTVDPNFLSYDHVPITVTVVVRAKAEGDRPGFNLKYESASGWKGTGAWFTIPGSDRWYTKTWTISDPEFVGKWGYHLALDSDSQTYSKYYLRFISVTKVSP